MSRASKFSAAGMIEAIKGSRGIKTVICKAVPCDHKTFDRWLKNHPTILAAYNDECASMVDRAHSLLVTNIEMLIKKQEDNKEVVDSADAKWYLTKKGKQQGFGAEPAVQITQNVTTIAEFKKGFAARLAEVDELEE